MMGGGMPSTPGLPSLAKQPSPDPDGPPVPENAPNEGKPEEARIEPPGIANGRPSLDERLNRGALGPRKYLYDAVRKSLYDDETTSLGTSRDLDVTIKSLFEKPSEEVREEEKQPPISKLSVYDQIRHVFKNGKA